MSSSDRSNVPPPQERGKPIWPWVLAAPVVAFFAYGFYAADTPEGKAKTAARDVIKQCWGDQGRKSLDPGSQRTLAGMCEKFEAEFREKYRTNP